MPAQKSKVDIAGKLSKMFGKSHAKHKDDETIGSAGRLPGGVQGIAQLTAGKIDEYKTGANKGKMYFQLRGVVKTPLEYEGVQTMIQEPLVDDPKNWNNAKTADEHYAEMLNTLRKLGCNTSEIDDSDIVDAIESLVEEGPHFRYSTYQSEPTKQKPNPKVYENWHKKVDGYVSEGASDDAVEDNTKEETDEDTDEDTTDEEAEDTSEEDEGTSEIVDWMAVGKKADKGSPEDTSTLQEACEEHGVDPDDYDKWVDVAAAIIEKLGEGDEPEAEEEEEEATADPETNDIRLYKPKGATKAVSVEVLGVVPKKRTATVKEVKTKKKHENVPFDQLLEA
jgi:hypothetical protein